jgi:hypothetical protein
MAVLGPPEPDLHPVPPPVRPSGTVERTELENAAIGAVAATVHPFTGVSPLLGGGSRVACEGPPKRGARTGAISGGVAVVPRLVSVSDRGSACGSPERRGFPGARNSRSSCRSRSRRRSPGWPDRAGSAAPSARLPARTCGRRAVDREPHGSGEWTPGRSGLATPAAEPKRLGPAAGRAGDLLPARGGDAARDRAAASAESRAACGGLDDAPSRVRRRSRNVQWRAPRAASSGTRNTASTGAGDTDHAGRAPVGGAGVRTAVTRRPPYTFSGASTGRVAGRPGRRHVRADGGGEAGGGSGCVPRECRAAVVERAPPPRTAT